MAVAEQICESVPYMVLNYLYDIHKLFLKHEIIFSSAKYFTFFFKTYYVKFTIIYI